MSRAPLVLLAALLPLPLIPLLPQRAARADEGMWPFDMVPVQRIAQDHHVQITPDWLDHVRLASVRFSSGGSGSFISAHGLVLTNHHVASDCIAKLASAGHDYLATGYLAGKDGPEAACPDLELDELLSIEDVTPRVQGAKRPGMSDADANRAIKATMASIEKECHDTTGLRCDVVTLYAGAMYRLYRYRRFTDVRLVFAPEADVAFFGGDPDNFNYPRYDLDLAIFRVYDQGQPVAPPAYLTWNPQGPKDGDVVFTSGNPASTGRDDTVSQLETLRDVLYPHVLARYGAYRKGLYAWSATGPEAKRQARESIFGVENGLKAVGGFEGGLRDPALMKKKAHDEKMLRTGVGSNPDLEAKYAAAWNDIAGVQKGLAATYPRYEALEGGLGGALLRDARHLVRLPAQRALPNDQRLSEYRDTKLDELRLHVLAAAPIYPGVEEAFVREWLALLEKQLGAKDPVLSQILAGRDADRAARDLVAQSKLFDVYARRALWDGGAAAVQASTDPLVVAMRAIEPLAMAARKQYEDTVQAPMRTLGREVAEATFAVEGTSVAPDATFTLRLSVGVVKGYDEHGKHVPWSTDFAGMYKHATGVQPLKLPQRWLARTPRRPGEGRDGGAGGNEDDAKTRLTPATPLDFVSTNDIIGGNSGSPVVSASGDLVGLIFDGNLPSLPDRFVYQDTTARAISVDTAAMIEALRTVYGADALAQEISAGVR